MGCLQKFNESITNSTMWALSAADAGTWRDTNHNTATHNPLWTTTPCVPMMALTHIAEPAEERQMENMSVRRGTFKHCVLLLSLLLVSATARADAVLDWNTIAVDTAVAN